MDIEANLREYTDGIKPRKRYASFDYCFNYFQSFREENALPQLISPANLEKSCLQLGFYLASWGMLRGSAFLLQLSSRVYENAIKLIIECDPELWNIDAHNYTPSNIRRIMEFRKALIRNFGGPTDILVTKVMLGVFGNVPAFDTYFRKGLGVSTFGHHALETVGKFYEEHRSTIENARRPTLDFSTGEPTTRLYTRAKIVDMIFFVEGGRE